MHLYDYQQRDVRKALKEPTKGILQASIMGAGKTLFAVEVARHTTPKQVLIVAPMNTEDTWRRTVHAQTGEVLNRMSSVSGENLAWENSKKFLRRIPGWYFVNWESAIRLDYRKWKPDVVIYDEIHRACARDRVERAGSNAHLTYTVGRKVQVAGGWRIGLSGTWMGNKPEGAWAVERAIWPLTSETAFWKWAHRHLNIEIKYIEVKGETEAVKVVGSEINTGSIVKELPCYIRHEEDTRCCKFHPKGVQADLPARIAHMVGVDLSVSQRKIYDQLEADMFAWIEEHEYPLSSQGYPMVNALRLHQVCLAVPSTELARRLKTDQRTGDKYEDDYIKVAFPLTATSSKLDALVDVVSDIPEGESILVFTHSAGIIDTVATRLSKRGLGPVATWHGAISAKDRERRKADFLAKRIRIIVAQVAAIGEGTDGLQGVCSTEIWLSMSENNLINQQALKRLHRPGQSRLVNSYYIYARQTIEKKQYEKLHANSVMMKGALRKHG